MIIILGEKDDNTKKLLEAKTLYTDSPQDILLYGDAVKMKGFLLKEGVQEKHIVDGGELKDTVSAAYNAKIEHFLPENKKEAVVITSGFRLERVEYIFWKVFGEDYTLHFYGVSSPGACGTKKIIREKQEELNRKAFDLLDQIKEGNHRAIKELLDNKKHSGNIR